ncbi:hypothetical protein GGR07_002630 [Bacteroides pyogenes]|nr:hypothetical protein [Bacteroides pyogenes]SUV31315.1 Uncharacterised protein [Bacteroides pyogenes]
METAEHCSDNAVGEVGGELVDKTEEFVKATVPL